MVRDKAKELLGLNLPNNVVASAIGVSESQVSQWLSDEQFALEVQELKLTNFAEHATRDRKYNKLEDLVLQKLEEKLDSGLFFTSPREILSAITVLNKAVRRATPAELGAGAGNRTIVNLQLPENSAFAAKFILNGQNQVVEIAGRSMATMSARGVVKQLEEKVKNRENNPVATKKDVETATDAAVLLRSLVTQETLSVADVL
jgi:predicted transcriptional regulator